MTPRNNNQYIDIGTFLKMLDEAGRPFNSKLDNIMEKLGNMATKDDLNKLRVEVFDKIDRVEQQQQTSYVPRDIYETRHAQLIERIGRTEETQRRENEAANRKIDEKGEKDLSEKDRRWLRGAQITSWIAIGLTVLGYLVTIASSFAQHYKP